MSERFVSPEGPPTARQREVLEILIEECAEVQQRATKILRFGVHEVQPGQQHDNAYRLGLEVGDLLETIDLACCREVVNPDAIKAGREHKQRQFLKFLQHSDPE